MLRGLGFSFQARTSEFAKREENAIWKLQTPTNFTQHTYKVVGLSSALSFEHYIAGVCQGNQNLGFFYVKAAECLLA